ncbi:histidine kinase [Brevundimonas sp. AAP58]|uniref:LytTR family DNA-binding domain-containing protein n=1 Tax=Brevundimonas sp. AAP58 TaxID=1523422 RepID=UPI0006B883EC|nr:LytTR family DNA-binding domain-containing protein [Brevundimonas sp. AAP58]KPF83040.1 histidine kinase [Brevundimonas sp. AAP58]
MSDKTRPENAASVRGGYLDLWRGLGIAVAAGIFLAIVGALGSADAPMATRLAYWIPLMVAGAVWGHLCSRIVSRWVDADERPWLSIALLTAAITGPVSLLVWLISGLVFSGRLYPVQMLPHLIGPVAVVTAVMSAINVFVSKSQPVQTHAAAAGAAPARFPERLPPRLRGGTIRAVQAEDHYLRIHTDRGSDLILMRLSDALDELEGLEGAQTHRSWWVAKEAVRDVSRGDGRATLTLEGGITAPVSRRYAKALRDAGWY